MRHSTLGVIVLFAVTAGFSERPRAATVFDNKAAFLAATGSTSATGPIPSLGSVGEGPVAIGSLGFDAASGVVSSGLIFSDFSDLLPDNELAISGAENFNVVSTVPLFSLGFDFAEAGEDNPKLNGPFINSTFKVTLLAQTIVVDSFFFSRPNDAETFVGVWSAASFNKAEIREAVGGIGNEFFGEFYSGTLARSAVPAPVSLPLFLSALAGLGFVARTARATVPV